MQPETAFKIRVLRDLDAIDDVFVIKIQQVSTRGDPDIVLCVKGHFVALELKTDKGRADPLQLYKLRKIEKTGGYAFIVRPKHWKIVRHYLSEFNPTKRKEIPACLKLPLQT